MNRLLFRNSIAAPAVLIAAFFLQLNAGLLQAQDLHIYYDLFTDSLSYQKDGKILRTPKIRKGDFIILHFTEYNPYLYQADVQIEQNNETGWAGSASIGAFQNFLPGLSNFLPFLGAQAEGDSTQGPMSFLDLPLLRMGEASLKLGDLFSNSRGTEQLLSQAQAQLQQLAQIQTQMAEIYAEVQTLEKSERAAQLADQHLDQLLHNPNMKPSLIRKIAAEYLALIFPDKTAEALQLNDAFHWEEMPAAKQRLLQELQAKQREYDAQMLRLAPITRQLSDLDVGSTALEQFAADLRDLNGQSGKLRQRLEAFLARQAKSATQDLSLEEMLALQLKFRELASQSFTYDCAVQVEKEIVIITASFFSADTLNNSPNPATAAQPKTKTVKLESRGGLHVNTGFGVGFNRLFNPAEEFSARDNTIVADESGIVQPTLTTFLHFYPNGRRSTTLAGTFGLGIPISGANISALNFYLGPSLLFGRGQRIVLSGGIITGPAERLAKGYQVGDPFDLNGGDIPTRSRYELGYFLGISFNLGK